MTTFEILVLVGWGGLAWVATKQKRKYDQESRHEAPAPASPVRPSFPALKQDVLPDRLIFLDLDGVLHRGQSGTLNLAWMLLKWLDTRPDIGLVISSTWRVGLTLEEMKKQLGVELGRRVVGLTAVMPLHTRQQEIEQFVEMVRPVGFCAIDDSSDLYPGRPEWLVLTDGSVGLDARTIEVVQRMLD